MLPAEFRANDDEVESDEEIARLNGFVKQKVQPLRNLRNICI